MTTTITTPDTTRYATIITIERDQPDRGHYYHGISIPEMIREAGQRGCFGATMYCYDEMKVVNTPSSAIRVVQVDDRLRIVSDTASPQRPTC